MERPGRPRPARRAAALVLLSACCAGGTAAAQGGGTYLFSIPVEIQPGQTGSLGDVIDVTLHVPDAQAAALAIRDGGSLDVVGQAPGQVTVRLGANRTRVGPPEDRHRTPSFVIDYDEVPVRSAIDELRAEAGDSPTADGLSEFVFHYIRNKAYLGSFDLASRVAATRTGDCTEHAVLLAALARASGLPARVVIGVVLVEMAGGVQGFGHAWTEVYSADGWQLADATLPEVAPGVVRVRYLSLITLDNEGPGFGMDLMRVAAIQPARIEVLGTATPDTI